MTWIGLRDGEGELFDPAGLTDTGPQSLSEPPGADHLLTRGSLLLETRLTPGRRPQSLLRYASGGSWPVQISISALPGGGTSIVLDQAGTIAHSVIALPLTERLETLQITYSWDAPRKWGRLAMEQMDTGRFAVTDVPAPPPLRLADLDALVHGRNSCFITPDADFLAVSDSVEPVGPAPSLAANTPIETPTGEVPVCRLRRGDTVITENGEIAPVLHAFSRMVPARGAFAPVRLRAPFFGLRRNTLVSASQRLKITGSVVDYMFGTEAVLANASHLIGGTATAAVNRGPVITYHQLLLPRHQTLRSSGAAFESLYIGRLRRKKDLLNASILAQLDRSRLPEHSSPAFPVLRQYDALVLAEQRSA